MKRRTTGRTKNMTRRRGNYLPSNNEELNQSNRQSGRRLRFTSQFTRKYVRKQSETQKFAFGQISQFGGLTGPLVFPNWQTGPGTLKYAPCTIMDLSSVPNTIGNTLTTPQTTWNIQFQTETAGGLVTFEPATSGWQLTSTNTSGNTNAPLAWTARKQDFLKWANIKFLFYTPLTIPTKVSIQIVQFKDPRLLPSGTTFGGSTEISSYLPATAFWQNYLKDYMYNPIAPSTGVDMRRWMKVIHSDTFILNPKDTDETANTRYKVHKIFKNFNRFQRYDWDSNDTVNLDTNEIPVRSGDNDVTVNPRARIYLIVRAMAVEQTSASYPPTEWWKIWPSADISVETCHMNSS